VQPLARQVELGRRWLKCGSRLFGRNPWLLGGMGVCAAVLLTLLSLIPLVGALVIALIAPILLASSYLAIDRVAQMKFVLPADLRRDAIRQSPRGLILVFRDEDHVVPTLVAGIFSLAVVLMTHLLIRVIAGSAWVAHWSTLDIGPMLLVLLAGLLVLVVYFLLAASLLYALPLAFLQDEALVPAIGRSFRASLQYALALLIVLAPLLLPSLLAGLASYITVWLAPFVWLLVVTVVLPLVATSVYCSYRTLFSTKENSAVA
jgi:hypothetical protein